MPKVHIRKELDAADRKHRSRVDQAVSRAPSGEMLLNYSVRVSNLLRPISSLFGGIPLDLVRCAAYLHYR